MKKKKEEGIRTKPAIPVYEIGPSVLNERRLPKIDIPNAVMFITSRTVSTAIASWLALNCLIAVAMADWDLKYCSKQNTATNQAACRFFTPRFFYMLIIATDSYEWQSNGECHDHCLQQGGSSFFVLQDKQCWCSDYIPADQRDIGDCSETCPGFPSENCGKAGQYYIYVNLNGNPKGTAGASQPSSTQVSIPSSEPVPSVTTSSPEAITVSTVRFIRQEALMLLRVMSFLITFCPSVTSCHFFHFQSCLSCTFGGDGV